MTKESGNPGTSGPLDAGEVPQGPNRKKNKNKKKRKQDAAEMPSTPIGNHGENIAQEGRVTEPRSRRKSARKNSERDVQEYLQQQGFQYSPISTAGYHGHADTRHPQALMDMNFANQYQTSSGSSRYFVNSSYGNQAYPPGWYAGAGHGMQPHASWYYHNQGQGHPGWHGNSGHGRGPDSESVHGPGNLSQRRQRKDPGGVTEGKNIDVFNLDDTPYFIEAACPNSV